MTTKVGRVAIIDADLLGRKNHRFPNLACMKIAGYHKKLGDQVELQCWLKEEHEEGEE